MKKRLFLSVILIACISLTGCAVALNAPVTGYIFTSVQGPITATSESTYSKMGTSSCTSILGLFATGNASIDAAAKNGHITKIHHVDYSTNSFLFIMATYTTIVYGE